MAISINSVRQSPLDPAATNSTDKKPWCSKLRYFQIFANAILLGAASRFIYKLRSPYYAPNHSNQRNVVVWNQTETADCFSDKNLNEECYPSFLQRISEGLSLARNDSSIRCSMTCPSEPMKHSFHLELAQEQPAGNQKWVERLKRIGCENMSFSGSPGTSGSPFLLDSKTKEKIGLLKRGANFQDLVAWKIAESSHGLIKVPSIASVYDSRTTDSVQVNCQRAVAIEHIPPRRSIDALCHFTGVTDDSFKGVAVLHLLMNDYDPHINQVVIDASSNLWSIDHDQSLIETFDFPELIRSGGKSPKMPDRVSHPYIQNFPFWMQLQLVEKSMGSLSPELQSWILSLDLHKTLGSIENGQMLDILTSRLEALQAGVRTGVDLPNLYHYMTPRSFHPIDIFAPYVRGPTIADDYSSAIRLTVRSFSNPSGESRESLSAAFHSYFRQIVNIRMGVLAGAINPSDMEQIVENSIRRCSPINRPQALFTTLIDQSEGEAISRN